MAEKELEVIIKAEAQNLEAAKEMQTQIEQLGGQVDVIKEKTTGANAKLDEHKKVTHEAAAEEHALGAEARESAKAFGELGAKGGELFERFGAMTTAAGGLQGTLLGLGLVAAGALVEGVHKVDEAYQEQQTASKDLQQATDAAGRSYEDLSGQFEEFVHQNMQFITNENEAKTALADFVRAGDDAKTSMDDLGLALDLSVGYHISLEDAAKRVITAEQGQGKALRELGIDLKSLKSDDENAVQAHKNLEEASKKVEEAQTKLATAQERLKLTEDELSGKHKLTAADADKLAAAHKGVDDATKNLTDATNTQKTAQDNLNKSVTTASQVHDELHTRLDNLRGAQDQQTQATHRLSGEWDTFASKTGPGVDSAITELNNALANLLGYVNDNYAAFSAFVTNVEESIPGLSEAAALIDAISKGKAPSGLPGGGTSQVVAGRTQQYNGSGGTGEPGVPVPAGGGGGGAVNSDVAAFGGQTNIFNIQATEPEATASAVLARLLLTT